MDAPPEPHKDVDKHREAVERACDALHDTIKNKGIHEHTVDAARAALELLLEDAKKLEGLVAHWRRQARG